MVHFAWACGSSLKERARLFYYAVIRRSLAHRGWGNYQPERTVSFWLRGEGGRPFQVHLRDNMNDPETLAEFFSTQYVFIPPEEPPFQPEVVYDIGANIGVASLYFATRFPKARLFAFEPVPENYQVCAMNFESLKGGKCFPWAIGAFTGKATFEFNVADLRGGRLKNGSLTGGPDAGTASPTKRIEVQVFTVADLVSAQALPPPDFLKIDAEGAEVEVLQGLGDQVKHIRRMLIETHGTNCEAGCRQWCEAHGFAVRSLLELAPGMGEIWCERR